MKTLLTFLLFLFLTFSQAQSVFVQQYGLRGSLCCTQNFYPLGNSSIIESEQIGTVSPVKTPMDGALTEIFISGDLPPFSIELYDLADNGDYIPVSIIENSVEMPDEGFIFLQIEPPIQFERGEYIALSLQATTNEPINNFGQLYVSHTIEWQYESGTLLQIVPVLGTWLIIILGLLLCIISVNSVKSGQGERKYA